MGTGGTRYGAGRPGYRVKAEHTLKVDIRIWHKRGLLWNGGANSWAWSRGNEPAGNIRFTVSSDSIRLIYSVNGQDASQNISTNTTPCHYGGTRPWFNCPACHNRIAVLYLRSGRFACRHCQRVAYSSQSGSAIDRVCNRFHKLDAVVMAGKPKWQRWSTFNRLLDRHDHIGVQFDKMIYGRLQALGCPDLML